MSHFFDQKGRHVPVRSNSHLQDTPTRSVRIGPAENLGVDDAHRITKVLAAVVVMATRVCQRTQREKRPDVGMRERECEGEAKKRIAISRAPRTKASFHSTTDNTVPLSLSRARATHRPLQSNPRRKQLHTFNGRLVPSAESSENTAPSSNRNHVALIIRMTIPTTLQMESMITVSYERQNPRRGRRTTQLPLPSLRRPAACSSIPTSYPPPPSSSDHVAPKPDDVRRPSSGSSRRAADASLAPSSTARTATSAPSSEEDVARPAPPPESGADDGDDGDDGVDVGLLRLLSPGDDSRSERHRAGGGGAGGLLADVSSPWTACRPAATVSASSTSTASVIVNVCLSGASVLAVFAEDEGIL